MTSDASAGAAGSNPGSDSQGGDGPTPEEKVAASLKEAGVDLDAIIAQKVKEASAQVAAEAGQAAQKKYDPVITRLRQEAKTAREESAKLSRDGRLIQIAALPPEQKKAAETLLLAEDRVRAVAQKEEELGEVARYVTAEKQVVDLAKRGIEASVEDFLELSSPDAMLAKAAEMRAEAAEKALKERLGNDNDNKEKGSAPANPGERKPPAASTRPGSAKPGTGQPPPSGKPWAGLEKQGLGSKTLAEGLRKMEEADYRGV